MGYRPSRGRRLLIAFVFMLAVAIPVFFIANAYRDRETVLLIPLTGLRETETSVPASFAGLPATWTPGPTVTARETFTPSPTTSPIPSPTLSYDFSSASVAEVVYSTDNGPQTLVKIVVPGVLVGEYEAKVEIGSKQWDLVCLILEESVDFLFCVGERLPSTSLALIQVFQILGGGEDRNLVFEDIFTVPPVLVATATKTKRPASTQKPKNTSTPTPIPTNTTTPTPTPIPTNTLVPTSTPAPTATCLPQPAAPPWASPTPQGNPPC